jgi:vacuolar-type H+-ATPase subunit H
VSSSPTFLEPPPEHSGARTALAVGAIIALIAANIYLYVQVDHIRTDMAAVRSTVMSLRDATQVNTASQSRHIDTLKQELDNARNQARSLSSQARAEATARAEELAKELQAEQAKAAEEISGVKQASEAASANLTAKIGDVSTDVGSVKTQLGSTQDELHKTVAQLKSVQGDLGVQSGLIATNGQELAALRRLGERNYVEFKLGRTKQRQRVGDISLLLKRADPKKNQFTIEVMADDKLTEKRDKNVNEPVQFYTSKAKQPYELVVNQVQKDLIVGYLATPREQTAR